VKNEHKFKVVVHLKKNKKKTFADSLLTPVSSKIELNDEMIECDFSFRAIM